MSDKTYRVGIIGLGGIASNSLADSPSPFKNAAVGSHTASLALMPDVDIVGYCDLVPELLDNFKKNWGSRWPNANAYTDYQEMLSKEGIDILAVATSDHRHTDITVDAAGAGVKGIFCEKPLAVSLEDADRMIKTCEDNGVILNVDHTRRWSPLHHKVRESVRSGKIGSLHTIVATLGGERAMLFRNGTHLIDNIVFYAESEPVQVFARLEDGFDHWDIYRGDGGKKPENDPGATGFIIFRNGLRAMYCGTKNSFQMYSLQLSGPDGQIYVDQQGADLQSAFPYTSLRERRTVREILVPDQYQVHGIVAAYNEIIDMIERGGESVSPAREARKTIQIMMGFLKSHQEGSRLVNVPE